MLAWNALAAPSLAVFLMCLAMATWVWRSRPDRAQNRRLATMLVFEGLTILLLAGGTWFLTTPEAVLLAWQIGCVAVMPKAFVYLNFLSTLDTPLARPLRLRAARILMLEGALFAVAVALLLPHKFTAGVVPVPFASYLAVPGPWFLPLLAKALGIVFLLGLVFSITAWRAARSESERRKAKALTIAFGTRDVLFAAWAFTIPLVPPTHPGWVYFYVSVNVIWLVYIPLAAYAILRTQLFDIDVRIKRGVKRSIVAGAFLAAFFAATQLAETVVQSRLDFIAGLVAAVGLAFAFRPLERLAGTLADRAMPGVREDPESLDARKAAVYRAALEGALVDGVVTEKERGILARLRAQLGISEAAAQEMERTAGAAAAT